MKYFMLILFGIFLLTFFTSCKDSSTNPTDSGKISGKVLNGKTLDVITGVQITTIPVTNSILNSDNGSFILNNIAEGDYIIYATKYEYNSNFVSVKVSSGKTTEAVILLYDLETSNNAPEIPELISPDNNSIIPPAKITLSWTCSDKDNDQLKYNVLLSKVNPPTTTIAENISKQSLVIENLDTSTTYYWKVIAKDNYTFSESEVRSFTVKKDAIDNSPNLILYYSFDYNNADDESGNNNNGTLMNNPQFVTGKSGLAARVVGTSDLLGNGSHILLPFINFKSYSSFTISFWVKEESLQYSNGESYINWGNASTGWIGISNFAKPPEQTVLVYNFSVGCEAQDYYKRQTPLWINYDESNKNKWVHFALIYSNGVTSGYINGTKVGSANHTINILENYGAIGKHWWNYNGFHSCTSMTFQIDEVRVYKNALTDEQISALAK